MTLLPLGLQTENYGRKYMAEELACLIVVRKHMCGRSLGDCGVGLEIPTPPPRTPNFLPLGPICERSQYFQTLPCFSKLAFSIRAFAGGWQ